MERVTTVAQLCTRCLGTAASHAENNLFSIPRLSCYCSLKLPSSSLSLRFYTPLLHGCILS